ncbi:hypothetical protein ACH4D5_02270 [Streptomyces sp. NPDC018029]|uniref:hypothetical protein n=1 Tax=Streptomyces sp. NPDC018029 TaxID=3365032 RepID=UPI0037B6DE65
MGALRRLRGRVPGKRRPTILYAVGLAGAAALGVTACDPVDGELNTSAVALTTDEMATKELERQKADVAWLSCTASFDDRVTPRGRSASADAVVDVDCQGETDDGKDIGVKGKVHSVADGRCVRGDLTAKVDGKQWFRVDVLGNCGADDGNGDGDGGDDQPSDQPSDPPDSHRPPPSHDPPDPAPTTTVTVTVTPDPPPHPTCHCVPGK